MEAISRTVTSSPDGNPFMTLVDAAASLLQANSSKAPKDSTEQEVTSDSAHCKAVVAVKTVEAPATSDSSVPPASELPIAKPSTPHPQAKKATFPEELMEVLEDEQHRDVLAWMPDGMAFTIVNHKLFVTSKMQTLFKIRNMSSFVRKLSRWGFQRVHDVTTNNSDVFKHPHFRKGAKDVLIRVKSVPQPPPPPSAASPKTTPAAPVPSPTNRRSAAAAARTTPPPPPPPPILRPVVSAATSKSAQRVTLASARKAAKNGMKNLVSQSHALKKALKNGTAMVMMTPKKSNGSAGSVTSGGPVYLTTAARPGVPVTPGTPQQGGGGHHHDASTRQGFPVTATTAAPTLRRDFARQGDARTMTAIDHRYMMHQQQYLQQQSSSAATNASVYSTYVTEPSSMQQQSHHMSSGGSASSVHERLLSVAEDPRLPAALRRRLVSVALDSLRDQLDEESGRSVISFGPSSSSSSYNCMDTSLGRSMSSLSSSTRSSSSTSVPISNGSPTSYPVMVMRPGGGDGGRATTTTTMHHRSYASPSTCDSSAPPYLPMNMSGNYHHPQQYAYRHTIRRSDHDATEVACPPGTVGGTGYPVLYR